MADVTTDKTMKAVAGGSVVEALGGALAMALAILGLLSILPHAMAYIATIAIGGAFLLEGGAVASRAKRLFPGENVKSREGASVVSGLGVEFIAGIAGIALGILALMDVVPMTLIPAAVITFGVALLISSTTVNRINQHLGFGGHRAYEHEPYVPATGATTPGTHADRPVRTAHGIVNLAAGTQVLVGLAAIALGVLALLDYAPLTLSLVALLVIGASVLLTGGALGGKVGALMKR